MSNIDINDFHDLNERMYSCLTHIEVNRNILDVSGYVTLRKDNSISFFVIFSNRNITMRFRRLKQIFRQIELFYPDCPITIETHTGNELIEALISKLNNGWIQLGVPKSLVVF
ncbi:MAG: hypothetical protein JO131_03245 [Gammaproteobacteria bacterium]|nr:hypothetical protein [Gammaproteobacteria bacterium]